MPLRKKNALEEEEKERIFFFFRHPSQCSSNTREFPQIQGRPTRMLCQLLICKKCKWYDFYIPGTSDTSMKQLEKRNFIETSTTNLIYEHLPCSRYCASCEYDKHGPAILEHMTSGGYTELKR